MLCIHIDIPVKNPASARATATCLLKILPLRTAILASASTSTPENRLRSIMTPSLPMVDHSLWPPLLVTKGIDDFSAHCTYIRYYKIWQFINCCRMGNRTAFRQSSSEEGSIIAAGSLRSISVQRLRSSWNSESSGSVKISLPGDSVCRSEGI